MCHLPFLLWSFPARIIGRGPFRREGPNERSGNPRLVIRGFIPPFFLNFACLLGMMPILVFYG